MVFCPYVQILFFQTTPVFLFLQYVLSDVSHATYTDYIQTFILPINLLQLKNYFYFCQRIKGIFSSIAQCLSLSLYFCISILLRASSREKYSTPLCSSEWTNSPLTVAPSNTVTHVIFSASCSIPLIN